MNRIKGARSPLTLITPPPAEKKFDNTPIIIDSNDCDETYTLDAIKVVEGTTPYVIFSCSSAYANDYVSSDRISIDNLMDVLEWITDNEEELFEGE